MSKGKVLAVAVVIIAIVGVLFYTGTIGTQGTSGDLTVTHYDTDGNPIDDSGLPFAFFYGGQEVKDAFDVKLDYTVSGAKYKDLSVFAKITLKCVERVYSLQTNQWVETEIYSDSGSITLTIETSTFDLNFDYSQIITSPDMEAEYVLTVSGLVEASAQSSESADTLFSEWSDAKSWQVSWQDGGQITVEGTLTAP